MCILFVWLFKAAIGLEESIASIKEKSESIGIDEIPEFIKKYKADERKGVANVCRMMQKKSDDFYAECERLEKLCYFERQCRNAGYSVIAGIDEVGRGPLAGPVVTAAVILKEGDLIEGVNDSKKLSPAKRELLYDQITKRALAYSFGVISQEEIDRLNILNATLKAMSIAIGSLNIQPDFVLVDAVTIPDISIPQKGIIKGDAKSISIGAASIIAKVYRDRMMDEYDSIYPGYGFSSNKGYGSAEHIEAIKRLGLCPIHRRSFVKNFVQV